MVTTDANPYYDSFVRWQVNKLYALGKIKFGERYTIYGQPCMDHDRQDGEGFGPQEYTAVKMEVITWSQAAKDIENVLCGRKVFLVAATLRPETMCGSYSYCCMSFNRFRGRYGQTNCFVGTAIRYLVFAVNDNEAYLCTLRAARNMAFQGVVTPRGELEPLAEIQGAKLVGTKIKAPFGIHPEVFVLPMENVLETKVCVFLFLLSHSTERSLATGNRRCHFRSIRFTR
jgi:leucyl-tRNA synthetase